MAVEDFTTYTEVDSNSRYTITSTKIDVVGVKRNEDAYVYDDKGVDHFNGDFEWLATFYQNSSSQNTGIHYNIGLLNTINDVKGVADASGDGLFVRPYAVSSVQRIYVTELDGGTFYNSSYYGASQNTPYYLEIERDESVGTYGTLYTRVYSDSERVTEVASLSLALHSSKKDFRYVFSANTYNDNQDIAWTGYIENLDLQEAVPGGGLRAGSLGLLGVGI